MSEIKKIICLSPLTIVQNFIEIRSHLANGNWVD